MSKIATELEAKTMLSVIDNKCCTKARALELGCQIKSGVRRYRGSYNCSKCNPSLWLAGYAN